MPEHISTKRIGKTLTTYTGRDFWPMDPWPEDVVIKDIAHALSQLCRFGGHCREFYSVAQHSVLVSVIAAREAAESTTQDQLPWKSIALVGLLHDASEAYLVDLPRPIKEMLPDYKVIEHKVDAAIYEQFKLTHEADLFGVRVKTADRIALSTECRDLMPERTARWADCQDYQPEPETITPLMPERAKVQFLGRYHWLLNELGKDPWERQAPAPAHGSNRA